MVRNYSLIEVASNHVTPLKNQWNKLCDVKKNFSSNFWQTSKDVFGVNWLIDAIRNRENGPLQIIPIHTAQTDHN